MSMWSRQPQATPHCNQRSFLECRWFVHRDPPPVWQVSTLMKKTCRVSLSVTMQAVGNEWKKKKKKNLWVTEKKTSLKTEINQWPTNESNRIFSSWHHKSHLWWETLRPCCSRDDCTKTNYKWQINCTNLHHVSSQHILKMMLKHSQWLFLIYLRKLWFARYNYWPEIGGAIRS